MAESSKIHTLTVCIWLTLGLCSSMCVADIDRFLDTSEAWLPEVPVVVTQEALGEWAGITKAGYDPVTGAWFFVNSMIAQGRDADGESYFIRREDPEVLTPRYKALPYHLGTLLPIGVVAAVHEDPGAIVDVEYADDQWVLTYRMTVDELSTPNKTADFRAFFDSEGRTVAHERVHPTDVRRIEFSHENPKIDQAVYPDDGPRYKVSMSADVTAAGFRFDRVRDRLRQVYLDEQQRLAAVAAGYSDDSGEWIPPAAEDQPLVPYAPGPAARWRMPLILGGGILVIIAIGETIRRRRIQ